MNAAEFYLFKLVFPDQRWDVAAKELATPPSEGDCIDLEGGGRWRVVGTASVRPRPSGKPDRALFLCAPA